MRKYIAVFILLFSLPLVAQDTLHLPDIVNYYQQMNFLDRNKKDTVNPITAAIKRLELLSQQSVFSKLIYKSVLSRLGTYAPAEPQDSTAILLNQMLKEVADTYTAQSPQYAQALLWCAHICALKGDNRQAARLMEHSCFADRDTLVEIFYLDVQSQIENNSGRDYTAIRHSEQSCELKKAYFGEKSEVYFNALLDLSNLYAERKLYSKANYYHNLGYNAYVERIKTEFCSTSESERAMFWESAKEYINKTVSIAHKMGENSHIGGEHSLASAAFNALLLSKGLLLNTSNSFENYIYGCGNAEAIRILQQKKIFSDLHAPQTALDSLDYEILAVLRRNNQTFELPHLSIRWEDVAGQLAENDVAVEFYRTASDDYGAILLKKGWNSPKLVRLKRGMSAINSLHLEQYEPDDAAEAWRWSKAVWTDEIVKYFPLKGRGRVFFAADGVLQIKGIEYLPYVKPQKDGSFYCLSDLFPMYRLSSTRELVNQPLHSENTNMAVYGGLKYYMNYAELKKDAAHYPELQNSLLAYDATSRKRDARAVSYIAELDGALKEADSVTAIINNAPNHPFRAQAYIKSNGTEASFKALQYEHPRLIHIATHGFFLSEEEARTKKLPLSSNPMARSGLLMAGAESAWFGVKQHADVEDGILTALEISNMDFPGLDMVVLSACETGIGDILPDGVFGLQRGFKMAGTESILMSLWKVDDEATYMLMKEFYSNWITNGMSKHDAFDAAKKTVRSHKEKGWNNPRFWAAFILLDAVQ